MKVFNLEYWNIIHATGLIITGIAFLAGFNPIGIYSFSIISFLLLLILSYSEWKIHKPLGGYANHLTLLRLVLLFIAVYQDQSEIIFIILLISIVLDAFDGWLARKFKTISGFGSFFDIETDAFFMLILCMSLYQLNIVDKWIIHGGLIRYYYVLIKWILGLHKKKEPRINAIRYTAIAVFILYFSPFILPKPYHQPMLITGSAILLLSFSYSFYRLVKSD